MELGEAPLVQTAASIFRELCYNYRDSLVAGILVAGWDKKNGGNITITIDGLYYAYIIKYRRHFKFQTQ